MREGATCDLGRGTESSHPFASTEKGHGREREREREIEKKENKIEKRFLFSDLKKKTKKKEPVFPLGLRRGQFISILFYFCLFSFDSFPPFFVSVFFYDLWPFFVASLMDEQTNLPLYSTEGYRVFLLPSFTDSMEGQTRTKVARRRRLCPIASAPVSFGVIFHFTWTADGFHLFVPHGEGRNRVFNRV